MFKRKILFFIVFLTIPLSSYSLRKNNPKINQIENQKTPEGKNRSNVLRGKGKETFGEELNINETNFKPNKSMRMRIDNNQQVKSLENYRKNFYLNFSFGYSFHSQISSTCVAHIGSVFKNHLTNFSKCFPLTPTSGSKEV